EPASQKRSGLSGIRHESSHQSSGADAITPHLTSQCYVGQFVLPDCRVGKKRWPCALAQRHFGFTRLKKSIVLSRWMRHRNTLQRNLDFRSDCGRDRITHGGSNVDKPLWQASAVEIVAGIREKRFSCSEVMTSVVERIRALNPKLNAIVTDLTDQALTQAAAADRALREGAAPSPLFGVPVTIKVN